MKYIKLLLFFFSILMLSSCGYKKLNSEKINDFKIEKLEINGEKRLAYTLKNNIEIYSTANSQFAVDIKIYLTSSKEAKIKNASGKNTRYTTELQVDTLITNTYSKHVYKKTFNSTNDYDVGLTHSDTLNNEKNATENNLNFISSEIIKYLKLLSLQ